MRLRFRRGLNQICSRYIEELQITDHCVSRARNSGVGVPNSQRNRNGKWRKLLDVKVRTGEESMRAVADAPESIVTRGIRAPEQIVIKCLNSWIISGVQLDDQLGTHPFANFKELRDETPECLRAFPCVLSVMPLVYRRWYSCCAEPLLRGSRKGAPIG